MRKLPVIVWKDFTDAIRSKLLWSVMGVLVLIVVLIYVAIWWTVTDPEVTVIIGPATAIMQLVVPLVGLIVGYRSIVGERQSGSIKVLLSLPPSRGEVVFGKFVGRSLVITAAVAAAFATFVIFSLILFRTVPIIDFIAIAAASILVGVTFVGIAVGISGAVSSRGQAMAAVVALYLIFLLFWDLFTAAIHRVVMGELPDGPIGQFEGWYVFLQWLNPIEAFAILTDAVLEESFGAFTIPIFAPQQPSNVEQVVAGEVPFYLWEPVAIVILVGWAVLPVAAGYYRFNRADLG